MSPLPHRRTSAKRMDCALHELADVLACTHQASEFAAASGLPERETWEFTIAFSEIATNVTRHGGGGHISVELVSEPEPGLLITAQDEGPGIEDVGAAFADDFSEGRVLSINVSPGQREGLGSGLGAVRRFTDDVQVDSAPGRGTTIRAFKQMPGPTLSWPLAAAREMSAPAETPHAAPESEPAGATPWLILGLGNAILCDDGVGIKVARFIAELGENPEIVVKEAELAGFALIDLLEGFERAIVVDAVRMGDAAPGEVVVFENSFLEPTMHLVAGHQIDLPTALEMGRRLGRPLPETVYIVGVQVEDDRTFSELCTPQVEAAIPTAAHVALRIVAANR